MRKKLNAAPRVALSNGHGAADETAMFVQLDGVTGVKMRSSGEIELRASHARLCRRECARSRLTIFSRVTRAF